MPLSRTHAEWLADGAACLAAALAYRAAGWCPIPLCPPDHIGVSRGHGKTCKSPGKAPLVAGWASLDRLPTEDELRSWWRTWANANVGLVMGKISGMVGLDVDGEGGLAELYALLADIGLPTSLEFSTPGGGRRLLFGVEAVETIRIAIGFRGVKQELRLLAEGAQTVAPPSRHPGGGQYLWTTMRPGMAPAPRP